VEESDPVKIAPPDKSPKKKSKEDKGKSIDFEDTPTADAPKILFGNPEGHRQVHRIVSGNNK
ncbi:hypothetical protein PIB30_110903, partial [Stylosanthes scabra]|nr:hypothetical protein [Stylosanthes scabra]